MKNLAEFSQCDELIIRLKEIAAHILSTDNMRLVTRLCDSSCCAKLSFFLFDISKLFKISPHLTRSCGRALHDAHAIYVLN